MKKYFTIIQFFVAVQLFFANEPDLDFFHPKLTLQEGYVLDSVRFYDDGDTTVQSYEYDVNSGKLTRYRKGTISKTVNVIYIRHYPLYYNINYNSAGKIESLESEYFDSVWVPYAKYSYSYNSEGRFSEKVLEYDGDSNVAWDWKCEYDSEGNLTDYLIESSYYESRSEYVLEYDSLNRVTSKKYYEQDYPEYDEYAYQYDSLNNVSCRLQTVNTEYSTTRYNSDVYLEFNDNNQVVSEYYRWEDGLILYDSAFAFKRTYDYNSDGNLITITSFNYNRSTKDFGDGSSISPVYDDNNNPSYYLNATYAYAGSIKGWLDLTDITITDSYGNEIDVDSYYCEFYCSKLEDKTTDVTGNSEKTFDYNLSQNYPNPFNPSTNISFEVAQQGMVELTVYDIKGARVQTLTKKEYMPGKYSINFDGSGLSSGVYFYQLKTSDFITTKKMMLLK